MFRRAREGDGVRRARAKSSPSSAVPLAVRGVAAGLLVAVALGLRALWLGGCFLPSWVRWRDVTVEADLDGDGATDELCVERRKLSVSDAVGRGWHSGGDWLVQDALVGDINHDGVPELVLLVWKRGSYGSQRPFWVERDEWDFSQHIFIYQWRDGRPKALWMSSRLPLSVAAFSLDAKGTLTVVTPEGETSRWVWLSWGLVEDDGAEPARLSLALALQAGGLDEPAQLAYARARLG